MGDILACRVCLATDINLYNMYNYGLNTMFEDLTGVRILLPDNYPPYLCSYCHQLLRKSSSFKEKCLKSMDVLKRASMEVPKLTTEHIRTLNLSNSPPHSLSICSLPNYTIDSSSIPFPHIPIKIEKVDIEFDEIQPEDLWDSDDEPLSKKASIKKQKKKIYPKFETKDETVKSSEHSEFESDSLEKENHVDYAEFELEADPCDTVEFELQKKKTDDKNLPDIEVVIQSKEEQIKEILARKESRNYQNSFYKCELCFKGYMTEATFKNHMARHDPALGDYSCEICHSRWPDARALKTHTSTAHKMKFICKICNHVVRSYHRAKEHTEFHKGHIYVCKVCGQSFSKSTSHLTHVRLHHKSHFVCDLCGDSFIGQVGLNMHKKKTHKMCLGNKPIITYCVPCKTKFKNMQAFNRHTSGFKDGVCDGTLSGCVTCGDNFDNPELHKEHQKIHINETSPRCYECNRNFCNENSLAIHYQRVHLGTFYRNRKSHGKKKVPVVCEICGLKCTSSASLVYHQRIHTGEKPFQCSECPKSFSVFQRLQIHIRTHTNERPFKCTHCPKAFKHKAALNRHTRVHTGVKPYQCPHCPKSFTQSNSMKLHVRTVHLKLPAPYRNRSHKKVTE